MARRLSRLLPAGRKKFYLQCRVVPCSLFFFSGAEIHPNQTFPYMGRLNRSSCRSYIKVRSDHQRSGVIFLGCALRCFDRLCGFPFLDKPSEQSSSATDSGTAEAMLRQAQGPLRGAGTAQLLRKHSARGGL